MALREDPLDPVSFNVRMATTILSSTDLGRFEEEDDKELFSFVESTGDFSSSGMVLLVCD
jgi:hypothetical protein